MTSGDLTLDNFNDGYMLVKTVLKNTILVFLFLKGDGVEEMEKSSKNGKFKDLHEERRNSSYSGPFFSWGRGQKKRKMKKDLLEHLHPSTPITQLKLK